jgi:hypothetical protein
MPLYCQILGLVWNVSCEWSRRLLVFKKVGICGVFPKGADSQEYTLFVLLMRKHFLDDRNLSISADSGKRPSLLAQQDFLL